MRASRLLRALGGSENVSLVFPCATKIYVKVFDPGLVDEALIRAEGAHAILRAGPRFTIVVGLDADLICEDLEELF